jgi:tetratricopeptide (TPR) repeat protein
MNLSQARGAALALAVGAAGLSACAGVKASRAEDPLSADEHMRLGSSYEDQSLRSAATKEYAAALRKEKDYLPALMALGNVAFQDGDLIESEIYYRRVLKLVPDHAGANNNLAMVFLVRGSRLDTAETLAKTALKNAGPFKPYVLDTLANVYMREGRYPDAKAILDEAESECSPTNTLLREHLSQSRRQLTTYSKAL